MSAADVDLVFELDELVGLFGDPLSLSRPELQDYWFRYERPDGVSVTLSLSGFERTVSVIVRAGPVACSTVRLGQCDVVRVLEPARKTLEITASAGLPARCFVSLDGDSVLDVEAPAAP